MAGGGYTGYAAVREVRERDRRWRKWKSLSQIMTLILMALAIVIAALLYMGMLDWRYMLGYWCGVALKHLFDFLCGRLR